MFIEDVPWTIIIADKIKSSREIYSLQLSSARTFHVKWLKQACYGKLSAIVKITWWNILLYYMTVPAAMLNVTIIFYWI